MFGNIVIFIYSFGVFIYSSEVFINNFRVLFSNGSFNNFVLARDITVFAITACDITVFCNNILVFFNDSDLAIYA